MSGSERTSPACVSARACVRVCVCVCVWLGHVFVLFSSPPSLSVISCTALCGMCVSEWERTHIACVRASVCVRVVGGGGGGGRDVHVLFSSPPVEALKTKVLRMQTVPGSLP